MKKYGDSEAELRLIFTSNIGVKAQCPETMHDGLGLPILNSDAYQIRMLAAMGQLHVERYERYRATLRQLRLDDIGVLSLVYTPSGQVAAVLRGKLAELSMLAPRSLAARRAYQAKYHVDPPNWSFVARFLEFEAGNQHGSVKLFREVRAECGRHHERALEAYDVERLERRRLNPKEDEQLDTRRSKAIWAA